MVQFFECAHGHYCINEILPNSLDESQFVVTKINRQEVYSTFEEVNRVGIWMKCFQIDLGRLLKCC